MNWSRLLAPSYTILMNKSIATSLYSWIIFRVFGTLCNGPFYLRFENFIEIADASAVWGVLLDLEWAVCQRLLPFRGYRFFATRDLLKTLVNPVIGWRLHRHIYAFSKLWFVVVVQIPIHDLWVRVALACVKSREEALLGGFLLTQEARSWIVIGNIIFKSLVHLSTSTVLWQMSELVVFN